MKMIERVLIFVLLILPSTLLCQVKILMPVVVKDAGGTPVTDLKESDFHVSGPKGVSIDKMWLVLTGNRKQGQSQSTHHYTLLRGQIQESVTQTCGRSGFAG